MRTPLLVLPALLLVLTSCALQPATDQTDSRRAAARPDDRRRELLGKMVGRWVLRGTIARKQVTHDVDARWVLNQEYVQIHEVSRERDAAGKPQYEAIVYVVWNPKVGEYACLWLDTTGIASFPPEGVGHAKTTSENIGADNSGGDNVGGEKIAFIFRDPDDRDGGGGIHTTFAYDRAADSWSWTIENEANGKLTPFAQVSLTRQ